MRTIKVTTKTSDQIAAEFETAFRDIKPEQRAKPLTQADRLAPYKKAIRKQQRRGLTWEQIAAGMSGPMINEKVSAKLLRKLFAANESAARPARLAAASGAKSTTKASLNPSATRLVLDPLTGRPIDP